MLNGRKYIDFLNGKEFMAQLVDFFLERKSPLLSPGQADKRQKMGSQYQKPSFEIVLNCLNLLFPADFKVISLSIFFCSFKTARKSDSKRENLFALQGFIREGC